jgi:hypothetical protein
MTMRKRLLVLVGLGLFLSACAGAAPRTTSLRVGGAPPDATVTIDDRYLGAFAWVQKRGVALPPGKHRITVEKAGYFPWDEVVEAREGDAPIKLDVKLVRVPD